MSEDFAFAVLMLTAGIAIIGVGGYLVYRQKVYYNPADMSVITEIDVPILGKVKTNVPALGLCFIGLIPVFLAQGQMKARTPTMVKFQGEVAIDPNSIAGINAITVGVTSGLWSQTDTPDVAVPKMNFAISVPDSWPSYSAYAFAIGGPQTRPSIVGTTLADPKFKLRIAP